MYNNSVLLVSPTLFKRKLIARGQCFSKAELSGVFLKTEMGGPTLRVSNSMDLRYGPRTSISNKCPGDVDAAGPKATIRNHYSNEDPN